MIFSRQPTQLALEKVSLIEAEAKAKGWSHDELYCTESSIAFPFGNDWGLVNYLHREEVIREVTAEYISLGKLRFYRPSKF